MTVKITGFADEIAPELTAQIAGLKGLGMSYVEMRGVDGAFRFGDSVGHKAAGCP